MNLPPPLSLPNQSKRTLSDQLVTCNCGENIDSCFIPKALARSKRQTSSSRIWTRVTDSITYNDNCYTNSVLFNFLVWLLFSDVGVWVVLTFPESSGLFATFPGFVDYSEYWFHRHLHVPLLFLLNYHFSLCMFFPLVLTCSFSQEYFISCLKDSA